MCTAVSSPVSLFLKMYLFPNHLPGLVLVIMSTAFMLSAIGMAAYAVGEVTNSFFTVFANHFLLIVAAVAGVSAGVIAGMTGGTVAVGVTMIDGEGVVKRRPGKGRGVMTG